MVLIFKQTKWHPTVEYEVHDAVTNEQLGHGSAADKGKPELTLGNEAYALDLLTDGNGGPATQKYTPILHGSEKGGQVEICFQLTKKVLFLRIGYDYRRITLGDISCTAYEVGFGPDKHFWFLYRDDQTMVAAIRKRDRIKNNCDTYELFIDDVAVKDLVCLLALFIDTVEYPRIYGDPDYDTDVESLYTAQKELLAKYDEAFIERVCKEAGFSFGDNK